MKFDDIPADIITARVKRADRPEHLKEQLVYSVAASMTRPDEFEIRLKDSSIFVKPTAQPDIRRLNNELATGRAMLAQLVNEAVDGSIDLQIVFFIDEREMGDIEIGVDEHVENMVGKINHQKLKGQDLYNYLKERCCFIRGNETYFFIFAGPAIDDALKDMENQPSAPRTEPTRRNSFCVTGTRIRFVATETRLPEGKSIYIPTSLTGRKNVTDRALHLAKGKLNFVDWTKAGQIQALTSAQMINLTKDAGSYLKKWDEFGDIEGELLLKRAREFGVLEYCDSSQTREGNVSVRISQASDSAFDMLAKGSVDQVKDVDEIPEYLRNANFTFAKFVKDIELDMEGSRGCDFNVSNYDNASKTLTIYDRESKSKEMETKNLPFPGKLILSLSGEIAQIKRRINARKAILEGRAANPQLGLLVEEKGEIQPTRELPIVKPLTAFVLEKIFKNQPTEKQKDAIEVALTTPDIALIQGPPGTGKTTVIAAIYERLNEMADKRGVNIKGQVLLTGFQHDAVENMIGRYYLNGLPIPKFGKRSGANVNDLSIFEKRLKEWCGKTAEDIKANNDGIANVQNEKEITYDCIHYLKAPTRALAANIAKKIASIDSDIIGQKILLHAKNIVKKLSIEEGLNHEVNPKLDTIRGLRIRPESFADDGPDRAADVLENLEGSIESNERDLLVKASQWYDQDNSPPFLKDLAILKKELLVRFTAPPVFRVEKQNDEVLALAKEAIDKIKIAGLSSMDKKLAALAEFLTELESNPQGMIEAVSDYSFAFAATCQQSVNKKMQITKGIGEYENMEYEYVIVDEAARVSPRDLMIPMAQGRRIILVGDHRQLPHLVDDEVARQMDEGETGEDETAWLKKSMFQYLFSERLKALEQKDGKTRCVTLDTQYRMHPVLGDFISRNFYERFDPDEKFKSGRPEIDFDHDLPGTDKKPAVWLDVQASKGAHRFSGTSWRRDVEATVIVRQLKSWMDSEEGKNLSYGVISFYKEQVKLIEKQLGNITEDAKKLRIGTVDSFQGMEFDVVFLSVVRTFQSDRKPKGESREKQARSLFGHLCLYNRLNVSMSRQKKLLVVVGDSGLLNNDLAREFIPGLVDFYDLCNKKGKVLLYA